MGENTNLSGEKFADYDKTSNDRRLKIITYRPENNFGFCFAGSSIKKVKIPNGVTEITSGAFRNCTNITSVGPVGSGADVEIPSSVTSIGQRAFDGCTGLTDVEIPNSVTDINSQAFNGCSNLETLTIPNSVTTIGSWAFGHCSSLSNLTVNGNIDNLSSDAFYQSTDNLSSEGNIVYIGDVAYCLSDTSSTQTTYSIKGGTRKLNNSLFSNNTYVTTVTMPNSVISVESNCFSGCTNLTDITLNNGLTKIGNEAFNNCSSLIGLTLPNTLTTLGQSAFSNCSSLTSMQIPDSVTSNLHETFIKCTNLTNLVIGDGVTNVSFLFETTDQHVSEYKLSTLVLGKSVTTVSNLWGFYGYDRRTVRNVTINSKINWNTTNIIATNLTIGKDFPNASTFNTSLRTILNIGTSSTNVSVDPQNPHYTVYDNCLITTDTHTVVFATQNESHNLHSQNTVTAIGHASSTIYNNTNKYGRSFGLPQNLTTIKSYALDGAYLSSLSIPASVTTIEAYGLRNAVTAGNGSFYCLQFNSLVPPTLGSGALNCSNDNKYLIKVPAAAYNTYKSTWSNYATRIIPHNASQLQEQWVDMYECCVNGELRMYQKRQLSSDGITWYDSYIENEILETRYNETVLGECTPSIDIDLQNEFGTSTDYNGLDSANYDFFESTLAKGTKGQNSMVLTLSGYQTFSFKIRASVQESYYQHICVNEINDLTTKTNGGISSSSSNTTAANNHVYTYTASNTWKDVSFTNLTGNEIKIKITYVQAATSYTSNSYQHKGYVAIPKVQP